MGAHTFVSVRVHYVFGTARSEHAIKPDVQPCLWSYMAGIARNIGAVVYAVGGFDDHAHVFIAVPPVITTAKAVQTLKANSSRWMHDEIGARGFEWQEGYGAFSVSVSQTDATIAYIREQPKHHKRQGFGDELAKILQRHKMNQYRD